MISGKMILKLNNYSAGFKVKQLFNTFLLLLCCYPFISTANEQLQKLLLPFSKINSIQLSYTETRGSFLFKKPQIFEGEILFSKPDIVIKKVLEPEYKKYEINGNTLTISSSINNIEQVNLDNHARLKQYVNLIKSILSGDSQYIQQFYDVKIEYKQNHSWILNLMPKLSMEELDLGQKYLQSIHINGVAAQIKYIKLLGFNGEYDELKINQILNIK